MVEFENDKRESAPADQVDKSVLADPFVGFVLDGRYRIVEPIGVGGWGNVYRATHIGLDRDLAIKIVHRHHLQDDLTLRRFEQEAKLLSRFRNQHVVEIIDHGLDPAPYIVMEYGDGISLSKWLKDYGPMAPEMAIELFLQLCDGLSAAEAINIVHRDLKPSNILIKTEGEAIQAKILDFGLGKFMEHDFTSDKLTATGEMLGSPAYMPPEQWSGQCDRRSDIYSLGCVMYETLTGNPAFSAQTGIHYMQKHCNEIPQRISEANPAQKLPPGLEDVVSKCMQKLPANRYQSVTVCSADLKKLEQGDKPQVFLPEKNELRKKKVILLPATITVLLIGLASAIYMTNLRSPQNVPATETQWRKMDGDGQHYFDTGELDKAKQSFSTALSLANQLGDQRLIRTSLTELIALDRALRHDQDASQHQQELASLKSDTQSLREDLDKALKGLQNHKIDSADVPQLQYLVSRSLDNASETASVYEVYNCEASELLLSSCRRLIEKSLGSENRAMARCLFLQSGVSFHKGDDKQAIIEAKGSLDILNKIGSHDDDLLTVVHILMGWIYSASAIHLNDAEASLVKAIESAKKTFGNNNSLYAFSEIQLADLHARYGKFAQAQKEIETALRIHAYDGSQPTHWWACASTIRGQLTGNKALCLKALAVFEDEQNPDFLSIAQTLIRLAKLSIEAAPQQARAYLDRAAAIEKQQDGPHIKNSILIDLFEVEAALLHSLKDLPGSELAFKKSLQIREPQFANGYPVLVTLNNLSAVLMEENKATEAQSYLKKAIALLATNRESFDDRARITKELFERYIKLLNSTSQLSEAKQLEQEYQQVLKKYTKF